MQQNPIQKRTNGHRCVEWFLPLRAFLANQWSGVEMEHRIADISNRFVTDFSDNLFNPDSALLDRHIC